MLRRWQFSSTTIRCRIKLQIILYRHWILSNSKTTKNMHCRRREGRFSAGCQLFWHDQVHVHAEGQGRNWVRHQGSKQGSGESLFENYSKTAVADSDNVFKACQRQAMLRLFSLH